MLLLLRGDFKGLLLKEKEGRHVKFSENY